MNKNLNYILSYVLTLIVGVLLLVYYEQANIFRTMVVVIGACLLIPSIVALYMGFSGKKDADGVRHSRPWYVGSSAIAGLIGGVLLVAMPDFFVQYLIYTLGVVLVVFGIIQILNLSAEGRELGGNPGGWYIIPWATVVAGIVILIMGPQRIANAATILTGIVLTVYSVNGLLGAVVMGGKKRSLHKKEALQAAAVEGSSSDETPVSDETFSDLSESDNPNVGDEEKE